VTIFYQQLSPRFGWLRDPDMDAVASSSPVCMAFDILYRDGRDQRASAP
jgi:hypothetical protein